jgi:hypothetical protein
MKRFWIGWYSGGYEDEGCIDEPPFQYWWTGQRDRPNYGLSDEKYAEYTKMVESEDYDENIGYDFLDTYGRSDGTACALVDAESMDDIWPIIAKYFPDYKERFCDERPLGQIPGDRFGDFENRTSLK